MNLGWPKCIWTPPEKVSGSYVSDDLRDGEDDILFADENLPPFAALHQSSTELVPTYCTSLVQ